MSCTAYQHFTNQVMNLRQRLDPYQQFRYWCIEHGFADVADAKAEFNIERLKSAIEAYRNNLLVSP